MSIITWEYYSSLYDNLTESRFTELATKAEQLVRGVIGLVRWSEITTDTFGYDVLKDCICSTINYLDDADKTGIGKGVTSVSNDGYSESFAQATAMDTNTEVQGLIRLWLSGTGLVGAY